MRTSSLLWGPESDLLPNRLREDFQHSRMLIQHSRVLKEDSFDAGEAFRDLALHLQKTCKKPSLVLMEKSQVLVKCSLVLGECSQRLVERRLVLD